MGLARFFAPTIELKWYTCDSLAFGGRVCYFSNKRKIFERLFNMTLGYPGEGPEQVRAMKYAKYSCFHFLLFYFLFLLFVFR